MATYERTYPRGQAVSNRRTSRIPANPSMPKSAIPLVASEPASQTPPAPPAKETAGAKPAAASKSVKASAAKRAPAKAAGKAAGKASAPGSVEPRLAPSKPSAAGRSRQVAAKSAATPTATKPAAAKATAAKATAGKTPPAKTPPAKPAAKAATKPTAKIAAPKTATSGTAAPKAPASRRRTGERHAASNVPTPTASAPTFPSPKTASAKAGKAKAPAAPARAGAHGAAPVKTSPKTPAPPVAPPPATGEATTAKPATGNSAAAAKRARAAAVRRGTTTRRGATIPTAAPRAPLQPPPTRPAPAAAPMPAPHASTTPEEAARAAAGPIDLEVFAANLARMMEEGGRAMAAYLRPREDGRIKDEVAEDLADVAKTLGNVAEYWLADPQRTVEAQSRLIGGYLSLWSSALKKLSGKKARPVVEPGARDGRFVDPEWTSNPFFDALKQAYLLTANWAENMVEEAEIEPHTKHKAEFYVRQIASAVSPSNFVLTNPELLRTTLASNGANLVRGMKMLAEDIEAGGGDLKIRQTDNSKFRVGENLAVTPGKVIFQNELMQLIQYAPQTETVLETPVVIIPPWINKFYVLDLSPEKSFIRWAVANGLTVFMVSWVNPGPELAGKSFDDYMRDGVLTAFEVAKKACGTEQFHAVGYCVGGTMLAMTLAWLAAAGKDVGVRSTTFLTTQVDFTYAGDLKVFIDEEQVANLERKMLEAGVMEGRQMANAFNMLRANDLIWPYVVNNYLKGQAPFPFDILYWNADSTRLPAANHSFYLRNCYLDNRLAQGSLMLAGKMLKLKDIDMPIYSVATREDHIAPAASVFLGVQLFGNSGRFVLAGSGHIAGVINPPERGKYQYWTGGPPTGKLDDWIARAEMHPGSWWPDWLDWIERQDGRRVPGRVPGTGPFPAIEDAPGSYVKVKA
nr:class I poly(R)-hydroxyalkanoic acid synthase [Ancylobacter moscoviensis]